MAISLGKLLDTFPRPATHDPGADNPISPAEADKSLRELDAAVAAELGPIISLIERAIVRLSEDKEGDEAEAIRNAGDFSGVWTTLHQLRNAITQRLSRSAVNLAWHDFYEAITQQFKAVKPHIAPLLADKG